jgi:glycosyltransferase involved in cell wall biosynthesis
MNITVILCTYNRCQSLSRALNSAAAQKLPESVEWEVLVVDNNSNDQTPEVVREFCNRYPGRFRYICEPQPGKSHALNAGIREARGDVLAFMDDDVTVAPSWLKNLTETLHNGEWVGAGGRILPGENFSPPRWLSLKGPRGRYALAPLALFDLGEEPGQLAEPPFGANMAFRKEMFEKHGGFRTDLGPCPGSEIRNEDSEFGSRLLAEGERMRYEPSAIVYHPVSESRIQKEYHLAWWFDKGRADVRQFGIHPDAICILGIPLYLFRRLAVWTFRWMVTVEPPRRFQSKLGVWGKAGAIVECYRRSSNEIKPRNDQN